MELSVITRTCQHKNKSRGKAGILLAVAIFGSTLGADVSISPGMKIVWGADKNSFMMVIDSGNKKRKKYGRQPRKAYIRKRKEWWQRSVTCAKGGDPV